VWRGVALGVVVLLTCGVVAAAALVVHLYQAPDRVDVSGLLDRDPAVAGTSASGGAVNILLLGSDSRMDENGAAIDDVGGAEGMRTDTTIIMHVSADRSRVELVSIPRDSLVDIPACKATGGKTTAPRSEAMINSAFSRGWAAGGDLASAVACAWVTVESATGVRIDHVALVDFAGFEQMVDAVGGVEIYLDEPMRDWSSSTRLDLPAGRNHLDGPQALDFVRARFVVGTDGSDIARIANQQQLLGALARKVSASDVSDTVALTRLLNATLSSMTIDSGLTMGDATSLAMSLRSVRADDIVFVTVPFAAAPQNPNRVVWTSEADELWAAMIADTPVTDVLSHPPTTAAGR